MDPVNSSQPHIHDCKAHGSCGHKEKKHPLFEAAIFITRVALAALAFLVEPYLFLAFFAVGFIYGVVKAIRHGHSESPKGSLKGCSNDFLEKMANITFPEWFSFGIGALMFGCHIEHHPLVFVPLMAGATGYWLGTEMVEGGRWLEKKFQKIPSANVVFA